MGQKSLETAMNTRPVLFAPKRGYRAEEAARYIGVSRSKFLELVARGDIDEGIFIDHCKVWDVADLDTYFDGLKSATTAGNNAEGWDDD